MCLISLGFKLTDSLIDMFFVPAGNNDLHSLLGQVLCDGLADAGRRGSDDCHLSFHIYL